MNWKLIYEFIITYWREILTVFATIITVVLYLVKRRPKINLLDTIKEDVLELLPVLINKVECNGNGQRKKNAVIELVNKYLQKKYQVQISPYLAGWLSDAIESILTTPTKKEGN